MTSGDPPFAAGVFGDVETHVTATVNVAVKIEWVDENGNIASNPPQCVILDESGGAGWGAYGAYFTASGNASDGLSHAYTEATPSGPDDSRSYGGSSGGHKYSVKNNPGTSIQYTVTQSFSFDATGSDPDETMAFIDAATQYGVSVGEVGIGLSGTTLDENDSHQILIGQRCLAMLSGPCQFANYQWSIPGEIFGGFFVDDGYGTPDHGYALPAPSLNQASPYWYWKKPTSSTISCTADAIINGQNIGSVSVSKGVGVQAPNCDIRYYAGTIQLLPNGFFGLAGDINSPPPGNRGMRIEGMALTPLLFQGPGFGNIGFTQVVTNQFSWTDANGVVHQRNSNGIPHIDNAGTSNWLYNGQIGAANGIYLLTDDSPNVNLAALPDAVSVSRSFDALTWLMYQPPVVQGSNSTWVPLYKFGWGFSGQASRPTIFDPWVIGNTSGPNLTGKEYLPEFPFWSATSESHPGYTP